MNSVIFKNLSIIRYSDAFAYQEQLLNELIHEKLEQNKIVGNNRSGYFLVCEHPHVITLGKSGAIENLLLNNQELQKKGIEFFHTNRGGDITYHGPGQIVGYPILDLEKFSLTVKNYMFNLEEVIIQTLDEYSIEAGRIIGMTGVWLNSKQPVMARKICAMGVKISRYVSMHGFALNVNTDLGYFQTIVPCGIEGKAVTSIANELKKEIPLKEVHEILLQKFSTLFQTEIRTE